jgi:16S rRNA (uracil1498-N3)-methyltransferase
MPHFFVNSKDVKNNKVVISDKENFTHIAKSLRTKIGEELLLIDENQIQYETTVESISNKEIVVIVSNSYKSKRFLDFKLYLAQSPLRSDAQNFIIEKATELGADGIFPIFTDNCALNKSVIEKKIPKWQRIMYEASKQCERAYVPQCFELTTLNNIINLQGYKILAFCERCTTTSLHKYCSQNPINKDDKVIVIIGPEGGFSQNEFDLLQTNNIPMLTLGDLILKAETAVTVALGNIIYEFENYRKN